MVTPTLKAGTVITAYSPKWKRTHQYMLIKEVSLKSNQRPYRLLSFKGNYNIMATFKSMDPTMAIDYIEKVLKLQITKIEQRSETE